MMPTPVKVGDCIEYTTPRVRTPYRGRVVGLTDMAIRLDSGVVLARRVTELKVLKEDRTMAGTDGTKGTNGADGTKAQDGDGKRPICKRCGKNPLAPRKLGATRDPAMCPTCYRDTAVAGAQARKPKAPAAPAPDAVAPKHPVPLVPTCRTNPEDLVRHALTMFLADAEPRLRSLEALRDKVARARDLVAILDAKVA